MRRKEARAPEELIISVATLWLTSQVHSQVTVTLLIKSKILFLLTWRLNYKIVGQS
jgi:hypothetical protein